ncbi:MAG: coproporphyrinogen III oxidase, partial [Pseudomonadota bacterium]
GSVLTSKAALDPATQADEYLMMSLRLSEGMSLSRYESLAGKALSVSTLGYLTEIGMIDSSYDRVKATQQGRVVLNSVIRELLSVGTQ